MPEKNVVSSDSLGKIKQAANEFKDTLVSYFKENNVEVKDWKFAIQNSEAEYIVDASVKIIIKPKKTK
jgi:hypothetical protein